MRDHLLEKVRLKCAKGGASDVIKSGSNDHSIRQGSRQSDLMIEKMSHISKRAKSKFDIPQ